MPITNVLGRASALGSDYKPTTDSNKDGMKPIPIHRVDIKIFVDNLPPIDQIWQEITQHNSMDTSSQTVVQKMYEAARKAKRMMTPSSRTSPENATERWNNILAQNNPKEVWRAINWKGTIEHSDKVKNTPSDKEFSEHFEKLLNPEEFRNQEEYIPARNIYIPILDDPIQPDEVDKCIKKLKTSKAPGPDGLAPGLLKHLPDDWIILLTFIYNAIFHQNYPSAWSIAKVFTIFKKGETTDPGNYRGISVMSAIAKVYDSILSVRFNLWYKPHQEQAGAQKHRG